MSEPFSTKSWLIGILISSFIVSFVVGYIHEAGLFSEEINPLLHIFRDGVMAAIIALPFSYLFARIINSKVNQ